MNLRRVCVLILTIRCYLTRSVQLPRPVNTVSLERNRVKIECSRNSSNLPIDWEFSSSGNNAFSHIYTVGQITENLSSRYKVDTDNKTRYDIVIDSVVSGQAGTYKCTPITDDVNDPPSYFAQLMVLASDPVCKTNASTSKDGVVEGDYIEMWCTVNYTGNWIPVMDWTRTDGYTIDANIIYRPTNTSTTITSSLITQLSSSDNGVTFTCKTTFDLLTSTKISITRRPYEIMATNVPSYQQTWNFTVNIHVLQIGLHVSQIPSEQSIIISIIAVGGVCCLVLILYLCNNRCPYKGGIARPEPDILQAVQINPYYIAESLEDRPDLRPVQAVHPSVFQGGDLQQQNQIPVYSEVKRKENSDDKSRSVVEGATGYLPKQKGLPIYTEVTKNRNGSKHPDSPSQAADATAPQYRPSPSKTHPGTDGTQYLDVTSMRDLNVTAPTRYPPMFSLVETYASIDHTTDAPPPLPPKRQ